MKIVTGAGTKISLLYSYILVDGRGQLNTSDLIDNTSRIGGMKEDIQDLVQRHSEICGVFGNND